MYKLLIDTSIWLDIAKTTKGEKLIRLLEEFLSREQVSLICPEIIRSEFDKNKERVISNIGKSISSHLKRAKEIVDIYGEDRSKNKVFSALDDIDYKIPTFEEDAFDSIQRINFLLNQSEILSTTDEIKLKAAQRGIEKKAPFHLSKNSIADSIIIESFKDYKNKNVSRGWTFIFVTHNTKDFSLLNGNKKEPHSDLNEIFDSPSTKYFISLPEALNEVNSELVEEIEFEQDWFFESRSYSEIIEVDKELTEKIWYNRHKVRERLINEGEIQIIDRKNYDEHDPNRTIVKDIWEGALKSAKKIEEKYGIENLYYDDFEWGMINGKLSALRWVLGEEWGSLYT